MSETTPTNNELNIILIKIDSKLDTTIQGVARIESNQNAHETRIRALEDTHTQIDPVHVSERLAAVEAWKDSQATTLRVLIGVWSVVVLAVSFFFDHLLARIIK